MEQSILFYCVKCDQLRTMEQAGLLFRTGFYRALYPLGYCVQCERLVDKIYLNTKALY
ncbi:hypothetical protein KCTCHS21_11600 [Cohnella abietis]|uniref:Uncharacterized protein n=1 Tax=Cohnella abietis TaxID=2507935 RepID=A0A3T1D125_9BACL|nr:hypothetical protein KCTCHS21_11600 [Cohnella abietis]